MDLGEGLRKALAKLKHASIIDAKTIREFNKELQKGLLAADVEVALVFEFTKKIEEKALRSSPPPGVAPTDYITNIVYEELISLMGRSYDPQMGKRKVLLMGLYGSGKTTTAAKLAKYYQDRGLSSAVICCDVSRPAAYEQLETLARQANVSFFGKKGTKDARAIAKEGLDHFRDKHVVICDTSGRSALDQQLIEELKGVATAFKPDDTMLVISADIGQIAGKQATEFNKAVRVKGVVVTKMDGSGKGGGALSAANAAKSQVMFIGTGEKLGNLEPYNSESFIGGLLGIPNIASLVENVQNAVKEAELKPEEMEVEKLDFNTFYSQLKAMGKMGPLKNVFGMIGAPDVPKDVVDKGETKLARYKAIIGSMTKEERTSEKVLHNPSRIRRIAKGSGSTEREVHELISDFNKMKKMFGMVKNDRSFRKRFSNLMQ